MLLESPRRQQSNRVRLNQEAGNGHKSPQKTFLLSGNWLREPTWNLIYNHGDEFVSSRGGMPHHQNNFHHKAIVYYSNSSQHHFLAVEEISKFKGSSVKEVLALLQMKVKKKRGTGFSGTRWISAFKTVNSSCIIDLYHFGVKQPVLYQFFLPPP